MKIDESYLARRRFLCGMLGGGVAAMGAGLAAPLLQYAGNFSDAPPPDFLVLREGRLRVAAGKGEDDPVRPHARAAPAAAGGGRAAAGLRGHLHPSELHGRYQEEQNRIYCACHDGIYDTEGRVLSGPPPRPLRQFFTKLSGGKLILALEKENLEKAS